jgi:DNA-binding NarL/FixJ family response regulator
VAGRVVGRDAELKALGAFLESVAHASGALVVEGEPGIGKSTVWNAAVERAADRGFLVLSCRPASSETRLSFVGLADLLSGLEEGTLDALPPPQRRALAVALLREEPGRSTPEPRIVATAFLSTLRTLAERSPVLVAVDDLQWLDAASRRVLEFALRRLGGERIGLLAAMRTDARAIADGATRLRLRPFNLAELHEILKDGLGATFPRPTLVRIEQATSGNPFFAIELARALLEHGEPVHVSAPLPVPDDLAVLLARRLRRLPEHVRHELLVASALALPTLELLDADAIAEAVEAGVVRIDQRRRVQFTHPLLAAAVYRSVDAELRRGVHRELAERIHDPEERARHLALATAEPDETVAGVLADATRVARGRGAVDSAIELAELACELSPRDALDVLHARRLELGALLSEAGDPQRARTVLRDVADHAPSGMTRARALLLLAFESETQQAVEAVDLCLAALDAAGDDAPLRVEILAGASRLSDEDVERKVALADEARALAVETQVAPDLQSYALLAFAEAAFFAGRGIARHELERAAQLEDDDAASEVRSLHWLHHHGDVRPSARLGGILNLHADELDAARREFEFERDVALAHGDEVQLARTDVRLAVIEVRAGSWDAAEGYAAEAAGILERTRQDWLRCWLLVVTARLHALRGRVEEARTTAADAVQLADAVESLWLLADCESTLGFLDLSLGSLDDAVARLGRAAELEARIGISEPRLIRSHADYAEALIGLGRLMQAEDVIERLARTSSPWSAALGRRCHALMHSARGDLDDALAALDASLAAHESLPIPFELGRTLLVKGRLHRRRNERRCAREALERSAELLETLGAPLWLASAQAELRRLGLRKAAGDELTPSEAAVASLAASGLTNKEIATRLFVSPKTVEANLARVYRKLGIRSRAELGARMTKT